ncbi:uncharacterized protein LOC120104584 [Phoenix dactylifera]|uniref:Uncharacterized protein LOC120104584 n=1 Tax=Phoenix dactylifera TaxID=42345 RepID=A0A8B8ZJI2_PHODC|nr:uncharacterized protein LOC120104584 [Phoenix dactylifera]
MCGRVGHWPAVCEFGSPVVEGTKPAETETGPEKASKGKAVTEDSRQAVGGGDRPREGGAFGPWLVTNRIGTTSSAFRKKEKSGPGARKGMTPASPGPGPSRTEEGSTSTLSPIDLEGWQKPTKVARRRTPEKDVSEAGASLLVGEPSRPGTGTGSGAEVTQGVDRAMPSLGRLEVRPKSSGGLRPSGPGSSPLKRFRSPPRFEPAVDRFVGVSSTQAGGKEPARAKARRPAAGFRGRSRSSPPPLAPVRGRPPMVNEHPTGVEGDQRCELAASTGSQLLRSSVEVGLPELGSVLAPELQPGETLAGQASGEDGNGGDLEQGEGSAVKSIGNELQVLQACQMAQGSSACDSVIRKIGVNGTGEDSSCCGGDRVEHGTGTSVSACHTAQVNSGGQHLQVLLQLMASAKGVRPNSLGGAGCMEVDAGESNSSGGVGCVGLKGDL